MRDDTRLFADADRQLQWTIARRMQGIGRYDDHGFCYRYDLGVPEADLHLRGVTVHAPEPPQLLPWLRDVGEAVLPPLRLTEAAAAVYDRELRAAGYTPTRPDGAPVLCRQSPLDLPVLPADVALRRISDPAELTALRTPFMDAFDLCDTSAAKLLAPDIVLDEPASTLYAIYRGATPLAAGMLTYDSSSRVAGLYYIATLPNERNQGFGKALVAALTACAFVYGTNAVILQASKLGEYVYRPLGFFEIGRYRSYLPPLED